jgi:HAD superfamily hydrolase (TIGR01549 family)
MILADPRDIWVIWAERRARKQLAGRDFGTPEAYYAKFFSIMSEYTGKSAAFIRLWYFEHYIPRFCSVLERFYQPRPGAMELFETLLSASIKLAVYSDYPNAGERLSALGVRSEIFGANLYGPETFGAQKPAPRPFFAIAENLGVAPDAVLVVGDRDDTDGAGAFAADMSYIRIVSHRKPLCPEYHSLRWKEFAAIIQNTVEKLQSAHRLGGFITLGEAAVSTASGL